MNPLFFFLLKFLQASCSKDCQSHFIWQYKFEFYFDPSPMSSWAGKPISLCRTHLLIRTHLCRTHLLRTHFAIHKKIWENKTWRKLVEAHKFWVPQKGYLLLHMLIHLWQNYDTFIIILTFSAKVNQHSSLLNHLGWMMCGQETLFPFVFLSHS